MRLGGFVFVLALVASPLSASAQDGEEGTTSEEVLQEPAPSSEPAPEEPALQLKLDDAGVEVAPSPPRTPDGFTLEEMELRVKRARRGLYISAGILAAGLTMGFVAVANFESCWFSLTECPEYPDWVAPVGWTGVLLVAGGLIGTSMSGRMLRRRRDGRDWLRRHAHYGTPRRAQWDLARSRLVF